MRRFRSLVRSAALEALAEPLSCVFNAFEMLHTKPTDIVLVIGAGPIGIMHALLPQHKRLSFR